MTLKLGLLHCPLTMLSLVRSGLAFIPTTANPTTIRATDLGALSLLRRRHSTAARYTRNCSGCSIRRNLGNARSRPSLAWDSHSTHRFGNFGVRDVGMLGSGGQRAVGVSTTSLMSMSAQAHPNRTPEVVNPAARTSSTTLEEMTGALFADLDLSSKTQAAISDVLGYANMTKVQEQSVPACLTGVDVLAKAKTGTGKTLAFLIPVIERAAKRRTRGVSGLIVSPTRELAQQIAVEAEQVVSLHKLRVMCAVGGIPINRDLNNLARGAPDIMVATPGRLLDLLQNGNLAADMKTLETLVFDEADQLLDMGFRSVIESILACLPPKSTRQTVLFSATMPADVQSIASLSMRPEYKMVDCVGKETNTHARVPQKYAVVPMVEVIPHLAATLSEMRKNPDHKVIVFFVAARVVQAYAELFNHMGFDVLETHSRKSQSYRTKVSEAFRTRKGVIMFTSDVSARGLDYPDVTLVLQVGMPSAASQYVHRLGRTARAGKEGSGLLLLAEGEKSFLSQVSDLPLKQAQRMDPGAIAKAKQMFADSREKMSPDTIEKAYVAWMGFYNSNLRSLRWTKELLVLEANFWATNIWGLPCPPTLTPQTVGKMNLKGVRGLIIGGAARMGGGGGRGAGRGQMGQQRSYSGVRSYSDGRGGGGRGGGRGRGATSSGRVVMRERTMVGRGAGGRGGKR